MTIESYTEFPYPYTVDMEPDMHHDCVIFHEKGEHHSIGFATYAEASDWAMGYVQKHGGSARVYSLCQELVEA